MVIRYGLTVQSARLVTSRPPRKSRTTKWNTTTSPVPARVAAAGGSHFTITSASGRVSVAKIAAYRIQFAGRCEVRELQVLQLRVRLAFRRERLAVVALADDADVLLDRVLARRPTPRPPAARCPLARVPAAAAVAVAGSHAAPPISMTLFGNTGWWLGVSRAGVTGTMKRTVVPLAPAPVHLPSTVFGSNPSVPSAHTAPSMSGRRFVPSVAASAS